MDMPPAPRRTQGRLEPQSRTKSEYGARVHRARSDRPQLLRKERKSFRRAASVRSRPEHRFSHRWRAREAGLAPVSVRPGTLTGTHEAIGRRAVPCYHEPMNRPVINWDGTNVPDGLKELPPGRYVLEPMQEPIQPSEEEEKGILQALQELDAGKGKTLAEVLADFRRGPARR